MQLPKNLATLARQDGLKGVNFPQSKNQQGVTLPAERALARLRFGALMALVVSVLGLAVLVKNPSWRALAGLGIAVGASVAFGALLTVSKVSAFLIQDRRHADNERTELLRRNTELERTATYLQAINSEIEQRTRIDDLTGTLSRRTFLDLLGEKLNRLGADQTLQASIGLLDIDHFKAVNDTLGHVTGDSVLAEVAAAVMEAVGPDVLVGRLGGEEFAVFFDDADELEAGRRASLICAAVRNTVALPQTNLPVTVSIGIAEVQTSTLTESALLRRADVALYAAKQNGRNRVELSGSRPLRQVQMRAVRSVPKDSVATA